jgi:hypothetical protein
MKDPEDIDLFSPDQLKISEIFDSIPGADCLLIKAASQQVRESIEVLTKLTPAMWQRACFEVHRQAQQPGAPPTMVVAAKLIFATTKYLAEECKVSEAEMDDLEFVRLAKEALGNERVDRIIKARDQARDDQ